MHRMTLPPASRNRRTGRRWKMDATMSQPYAWVCLMPLGMMRCDSTLAEVRSDHRDPSPKQLNPDTACPFAGRIVDGMRRPHPPKNGGHGLRDTVVRLFMASRLAAT